VKSHMTRLNEDLVPFFLPFPFPWGFWCVPESWRLRACVAAVVLVVQGTQW